MSASLPKLHVEPAPELLELSDLLGLPIAASLDSYLPDAEYVETFDIGFSRDHRVVGLKSPANDNTELLVAICDQQGWQRIDTITRILGKPTKPLLVASDQIASFINSSYSARGSVADEMLETFQADDLVAAALESQSEDLLDDAGRAPIIRLVNQILLDSVIAGASDIHLQPAEDRLLVRQRIDGILFDAFSLPKAIQEEVLSRIKVLGQMNIAEKRLPQDGRATVELGDRIVDLRIASLPTSHNERIVVRLLDKSARLYTLGELGMSDETLTAWRQLIRKDHGLILVTGPTGSGKSTTLYGALQEINSQELNVLTLEDPIEYQLPGISQSQINERKGLTFASGMRSILRQDPDIIMVGEIRDHDTATMAIQASLTGHLVFSTLHTNDAASAATRLLDLGIEPYLVASSLVASLAQRLIRQLCVACRRPISSTTASVNPRRPADRYEAVGCPACRDTGFSGRIGLFELMEVDEGCQELIQNRANAAQLREHAVASGMDLLASDGVKKVAAGQTTVAEVLRATTIESESE